MINTGLTSDNVKSVCSAVRNEISSRKPFDGEVSAKTILAGVRARDRVCLRDDKAFGVTGALLFNWIDGDGGRVGRNGGEDGVLFRKGVLEVGVTAVLVFFFALKGRKNDHSDSNWTPSSSEESGAFSRSAASSNWSILRSAKRMMKTGVLGKHET